MRNEVVLVSVRSKSGRELVAIWGHCPPPYGGMTVHISRLLPKLKETGIRYQLYNFSNRSYHNKNVHNYSGLYIILWIFRLFFGQTPYIHYVFSVRAEVRFLAVFAGMLRGKKIILRIGGGSLHKGLNQGTFFSRVFTRFAMKHASAIVGVNQNICQLALQAGADPATVKHIPGFIPPPRKAAGIPEAIHTFYENKSPKLLIAGVIPHTKDKDLYGIHGTVEMMQVLLGWYPNAGLVISSQNHTPHDTVVLTKFRRTLSDCGLERAIMVLEGEGELWPLMEVCDIFLRTTLSDGDSNSIREALYIGTPVVASDCVERPEGTVIFPTGDWMKLAETVRQMYDNIEYHKSRIQNIDIPDFSQDIIALIKDLSKVTTK